MNEKRTHIDLFSGIGGFTLAAESGFRTIQFVENSTARKSSKALAKSCHEDIKTFSWKQSESPFLITLAYHANLAVSEVSSMEVETFTGGGYG